jgi:hypothetical protein
MHKCKTKTGIPNPVCECLRRCQTIKKCQMFIFASVICDGIDALSSLQFLWSNVVLRCMRRNEREAQFIFFRESTQKGNDRHTGYIPPILLPDVEKNKKNRQALCEI